jgi:predicted amidophosphoribosyltransferase
MEEHYQPPARLTCKNCSTELAGENYCPVCGQKGDTHVLTFRELL